MARVFNPDLFRRQALEAGYDPRVVEQELQRRLAIEQAPQAVESGALDPTQALEAVGGLGAPGSEDILNIARSTASTAVEPQDEKERLFMQASETAKSALDTFRGGDVKTGPVTTRVQQLREKLPGAEATEGSRFRAQLAAARTIVRNALLGGAITEQEAASLEDALPSATDQEALVEQRLEEFIKQFGGKFGVSPDTVDAALQSVATQEEPLGGFSTADTEDIVFAEEMNQTPPSAQGGFKSLAQNVANIAPVAGGILGGVGGSIAGLGIGSIPGGAAGAAIGTGAGIAVQNMIEDIAGIQDESGAEQLNRAISDAAIAGVTDLALGTAFKVVAKGGNLVLKSVTKGIDDIPLRGIRVNPSQLTNFNKKHGQDLAEFMIDNKILGENAMDLASQKASSLQEGFDALAMNENIAIPVSKLRERFGKELAKLAGVSDEGVKTQITPSVNKGIAKKVLDEWKNIESQLVGIDSVTPAQLTEFRRMLDDVIPQSQFVNPSVKNVALRVRKIMNDTVQEGVDARLIGEGSEGSLKRLGQELSKYYDFLEIAEKQSNLGRGSVMANLTRLGSTGIGGGIGASVGGVPGAIVGGGVGLTAESLLRDPEVLAQILKIAQSGRSAANIAKPGADLFLDAASRFIPAAGGVTAAQLD